MWLAAPDTQGVLTLRAVALPALDGAAASTAALGDVDSDGDLDLYVSVLGAPDQLLLNDGSSNFADPGQWLGAVGSTAVAFGDLDGDDLPDLFVAAYTAAHRL
ncbi:MAG: FG-GAP-like repeat-containing protein [Caldilinea sp.]